MLDESQASSVFVLTTFQQSPLHLSFVHHKAQRALTTAFEAETNAQRLVILDPMRGLSGMPAELSGNIEMAAVLCDDSEPHCLARFIYDNRPQATKMAAHWHPEGVIGAIGRLCDEVTYEVFAAAGPPS